MDTIDDLKQFEETKDALCLLGKLVDQIQTILFFLSHKLFMLFSDDYTSCQPMAVKNS